LSPNFLCVAQFECLNTQQIVFKQAQVEREVMRNAHIVVHAALTIP
jgi:hypothetical protein